MSNEASTLSTGKYDIEFGEKGTNIFTTDAESGQRQWMATVSDPETATKVVEGLILVEHKRFYRPEAAPVFHTVENKDKPVPPFLTKGTETL
jgi:hypothetical protein